MGFKQILNNQSLVDNLKAAVVSGNIHHGYIIEGPATADKELVAKSFAKAVLCKNQPAVGCDTCSTCLKINGNNYIDLCIVEATLAKGSSVSSVKDNDIDRLIERMSKKPFEGDRNIAIIKDGDTMSTKAANHLLKTLEEPPAGTIIMILSENVYNLPNTILSRSIHLRVEPWQPITKEKNRKLAVEMVDLIKRDAPYYQMKAVIDKLDKERPKAMIFLDQMEELLGEEIRVNKGEGDFSKIFGAIKAIEDGRTDIQRDMNVGYTIKRMVLAIGG